MDDRLKPDEYTLFRRYFAEEKEKITVPPFPEMDYKRARVKKERSWPEMICALALSAAACGFVLSVPGPDILSDRVVQVFETYEIDKKIPQGIKDVKEVFQYNYVSRGGLK